MGFQEEERNAANQERREQRNQTKKKYTNTHKHTLNIHKCVSVMWVLVYGVEF